MHELRDADISVDILPTKKDMQTIVCALESPNPKLSNALPTGTREALPARRSGTEVAGILAISAAGRHMSREISIFAWTRD